MGNDNEVLVDPNRDAFLQAVMRARTLEGVETCMDHYDRLMNQINRLEQSEKYWRNRAKRLEKELDAIGEDARRDAMEVPNG